MKKNKSRRRLIFAAPSLSLHFTFSISTQSPKNSAYINALLFLHLLQGSNYTNSKLQQFNLQ